VNQSYCLFMPCDSIIQGQETSLHTSFPLQAPNVLSSHFKRTRSATRALTLQNLLHITNTTTSTFRIRPLYTNSLYQNPRPLDKHRL
jgi:hypothetical protein